jgi:hypothetical protein
MLNNNNSLQQIKDTKQQVDSPFLVHQWVTRHIHKIMRLCYHPNKDIINTTIYLKKNIFHKSKYSLKQMGLGYTS